MSHYLGDYPVGSTIYVPFATYDKDDGSSITMTGLAVTDIEIYKNNSMTQRASDAGYTLLDTDGIDLDGITGIHGFSIDANDNTDAGFYAAGGEYTVVVSSITVDGVTVNFIAGTFSIERTGGALALLKNATYGLSALETLVDDLETRITDARMGVLTDLIDGGRLDLILDGIESHVHATDGHITADYGATEKAAIDLLDDANGLVNIHDTLDLVHTDVDAILADTNELQTDWVNGGRLDLIVDGIEAHVHTIDGHITADYGTTEKNAIDLLDDVDGGLGDIHAVVNDIHTDVADLHTDLGTALGYIDTEVAAILADTNELQTDWANGGRLDLILDAASAPSAAAVADAVWDEALSGHSGVGSAGQALTAAGGAADPLLNAVPGAYGSGTAGYVLGTYINHSLTDIHTDIGTVHTDIDAILADTNELQTDWVNGGRLDLLIDDLHTDLGTALTNIADLHTDLGTALEYIDTEVAAILADTNELQTDWVNGGRLDLLVDSIITNVGDIHTDVGTVLTNLATVDGIVDSILADTGELQTDWVNGGRLDLLVDSIITNVADLHTDVGTAITNIATVDGIVDSILADTNELQTDLVNGGRLDLLVDAIKAKTDTIPTNPLAEGSVVEGTTTVIQSLRLINASTHGKLLDASTGTLRFRNIADSKNVLTVVTDADGNRTTVTRDAT